MISTNSDNNLTLIIYKVHYVISQIVQQTHKNNPSAI